MNLPHDFKEMLEEFAREGVEHVVIGGYAFAFHVEPRATKDVDLLIEGSDENRARAAQRHTMLTRCRFRLERDYEGRHGFSPLGVVSGDVALVVERL